LAVRSGLGAQFGIKKESTYGTRITVDKFTYIESESLKLEQGVIESPFLGTTVLQTSQASAYTSGAGGDILFPFFNKGMGVILEQCFGTAVVAQVASTIEYTHTFTIDATNGKTGLGATVQVLKPNTVGSLVNPFTVEGAKLATTWLGETGDFATTLATASYATNLAMFNWTQAVVTLNSVAFSPKSFEVTCEFAVDDNRRFLGSTSRREPIMNDSPGVRITGSLSGEFDDLTAYNLFAAGTYVPLVVTITGGTIPTIANPYKVVLTMPNVRLTGDTPVVGGPGVVEQPATFEAAASGATAAITLVTNSDESTL
jgi:hypothetical protein